MLIPSRGPHPFRIRAHRGEAPGHDLRKSRLHAGASARRRPFTGDARDTGAWRSAVGDERCSSRSTEPARRSHSPCGRAGPDSRPPRWCPVRRTVLFDGIDDDESVLVRPAAGWTPTSAAPERGDLVEIPVQLRRRGPRRGRQAVGHRPRPAWSPGTPSTTFSRRSAASRPGSPTSPGCPTSWPCRASTRPAPGCRQGRWPSPARGAASTRPPRPEAGGCSGAPTRRCGTPPGRRRRCCRPAPASGSCAVSHDDAARAATSCRPGDRAGRRPARAGPPRRAAGRLARPAGGPAGQPAGRQPRRRRGARGGARPACGVRSRERPLGGRHRRRAARSRVDGARPRPRARGVGAGRRRAGGRARPGGVRSYLAVAGGIAVEPVLGSRVDRHPGVGGSAARRGGHRAAGGGAARAPPASPSTRPDRRPGRSASTPVRAPTGSPATP